jgi:hypothetical protein
MNRKKKENKSIRRRYEVTGSQLIQEGKLDPYYHLKDHIDVKEEQLKNKTDWWKKMITT